MKRDGKFRKFIKNPGKWLWAFYGALLAVMCAMTVATIFWSAETPVVYVLSAVLLALVIYCVIFTVKYVRAFISRKEHKHRFTAKLAGDYGFRTRLFSGITFVINVAYAVFQTVMAIIYRSMWYITFAVYYSMLCAAVGRDAMAYRRYSGDSSALQRSKLSTYFICGILLILLSAAPNTTFFYMTVISDASFRYAGLTIYVMAIYAFYKMISAIVNLTKAKNFNDYGVQALRNINFTDALVSVFAMQTAMIATFSAEGDNSLRPMNSVMAIIVCLVTLGMGIHMIIKSAVVRRRAAKLPVRYEEEATDPADGAEEECDERT